MEEKITTVSGELELASNCRKIGDEYYKIGDVNIENSGDCYFIKDKYRKVKTKFIVFDHRIGRYVLKGEFNDNKYSTEKGIISFNEKGEPQFGAFSMEKDPEIYNPKIKLKTGDSYYGISFDIVTNNFFYKECLSDGIYYWRQLIDSEQFFIPDFINMEYKNSLSYDSRGLMKDLIKKYNENYSMSDSESFNWLPDLTKGLSFGVEFETVKGYVPEHLCYKHGLMPLRDGSIKGLEYVTIPLEGNKGLNNLLDILKILNKRTTYDNDCSLHFHIGNLPRTEEFFLALFKVLFVIQDEIFSLFPLYKKENYKVKRKAYTKPLPFNNTMMLFDSKIDSSNIKKNFDILYRFLSMGHSYSEVNFDLNNVKSHPSDPGANSKWNIKTRYHWVNLIPLLFGNKETVEFRIHTATLDEQKIMNFLLVCFAIIDFVKKNEKNILQSNNFLKNIDIRYITHRMFNDCKITDSNMISVLNNISNEITIYNQNRRHFIYNSISKGDIRCNEDNFGSHPHYFNWKNLNLKKYFKSSKISKSLYDNISNTLNDIQFINPHNAQPAISAEQVIQQMMGEQVALEEEVEETEQVDGEN